MARSTWKGVYLSKSIISYLTFSFFFKQHKWVVFSRNSTIPKDFNNNICGIHKGYSKRYVLIRKLHIGHKFGQLSFTRKNYHFTPKDKKLKLRR